MHLGYAKSIGNGLDIKVVTLQHCVFPVYCWIAAIYPVVKLGSLGPVKLRASEPRLACNILLFYVMLFLRSLLAVNAANVHLIGLLEEKIKIIKNPT